MLAHSSRFFWSASGLEVRYVITLVFRIREKTSICCAAVEMLVISPYTGMNNNRSIIFNS
jgi:hypothetical protein